jgi:hypothetical protein
MPVKVASICPVRRSLAKPLFFPQKFWFTPPVLKGHPPAIAWFNDDIVQVNSYRAFGVFGDDPIPAPQIAQSFIDANMGLPFCHPPDMMPGLWIVGSLGQNEEFAIMGGSNGGATMLQLDHGHRMNATGEITISGGIGLWAVLNGKWMASPAGEQLITVPVDSRSFGEFSNGGVAARVSIQRSLTLEQEAEIMRPRQEKWLERCLQDARFLWNREKSNRKIQELHHIAAAWFGIEGEDWQIVMDTSTSMECRYCKKRIPKDAATCAYCHSIANATLHAQLKTQEEEALRAERKKLKDAQLEIDRKIRELNKQKEVDANAEALVEQETIG